MIRRTTWIFFVVSISLLLGGLLFIRQERAIRHRAEAMLRKTTQNQLAAEAELSRANERLHSLEMYQAELTANIRKTVLPRAANLPQPIPNFQEKVNHDPHLQLLNSKARRAALKVTYTPLFQKLGLSETQTQAIEDAMILHEEQRYDLIVVVRQQGLSMQEPAISKLFGDLETQYAQTRAQLLGVTGNKELQEFERTAILRELVSGSVGSATVAGVPFTSAQAEKLVQLIAASTPEFQKIHSAIDIANIDWEIVDAQAREILSPEQFTAFQTLESQSLRFTASRQLTRLDTMITQAAEAERAEALSAKSAGGS